MGNPKRNHSGRRGRRIHVHGRQGKTVIDYVLGDGNTRRGIQRMEVGDKVESDHHLLVVPVKRGRKGRRKKEKRERRTGSGKWSQRIKKYMEKGWRGREWKKRDCRR